MVETAPAYKVSIGDAERDRQRVIALWLRATVGQFLSQELAEQRYDWFYLKNPRGCARIYLLHDCRTNEMVGVLGAGTRLFTASDGTTLRGSLLVDFVVSPAHRSMFPALLLQRVAREQEAAQADFIYGLPAEKALPIFKRLGSDVTFEYANYVRVVRSIRFLERVVPKAVARLAGSLVDRTRIAVLAISLWISGVSVSWQDNIDDSAQQVYENLQRTPGHGWAERTVDYLRWRFSMSGHGELGYLRVTQAGAPAPWAYFIVLRNGPNLKVLDFLVSGSVPDLSAQFGALALACWRSGADAVRLDFSGDSEVARALHAAGFTRRSVRPGFVMFGAGMKADERSRKWNLTRADEDIDG